MKSLFNIFYPATCKACDAALKYGENMICTSCRHELPVTAMHYRTQQPIQKLLYGRAKIELGTALFYFDKKSLVQNLIHNLKYRGDQSISGFLGKWLGSELAQIPEYKKIDCVIPVPLHKSRRRKRGYNQVTGFGKEIAQ
ncbi:MAG: ComF family protein, partial [Leeuwenhoekiella sp.]